MIMDEHLDIGQDLDWVKSLTWAIREIFDTLLAGLLFPFVLRSLPDCRTAISKPLRRRINKCPAVGNDFETCSIGYVKNIFDWICQNLLSPQEIIQAETSSKRSWFARKFNRLKLFLSVKSFDEADNIQGFMKIKVLIRFDENMIARLANMLIIMSMTLRLYVCVCVHACVCVSHVCMWMCKV